MRNERLVIVTKRVIKFVSNMAFGYFGEDYTVGELLNLRTLSLLSEIL